MFKKGDIVVAKEDFLAENETLQDTIGIVTNYTPHNDYLQIGVLNPGDYAFPPIFSTRGCYYRTVSQNELTEWNIAIKL